MQKRNANAFTDCLLGLLLMLLQQKLLLFLQQAVGLRMLHA
jgi:hypothetical protein